MTTQLSMLEYLASLRQYGCTPQNIGDVTIGRTVYAAGSFDDPRNGKRIALMPMYRTDKVTQFSTGPTPELLPASYQRNFRTVYFTYDSTFYISGYNRRDNVLWLNMTDRDNSIFSVHRRLPMNIHFREPFEVALSLASREVLDRIAAS